MKKHIQVKMAIRCMSYLFIALSVISCDSSDNKKTILAEKSLFDKLETDLPAVVPAPNIPPQLTGKLRSVRRQNYGIDISHFQGGLMSELPAKRDSLQFVICKATQGTDYVDPMFRTNWRAIAAKGFVRGAYHFYDCSQDPQQQAQHFYAMIRDIKPYDIAPILDIEQGGLTKDENAEEVQRQARAFMEELQRLCGRKPVIYSDYGFMQQYLNDPYFAKYDLWLAEYSGNQQPLIPDVWKEKGFLVWQRSDNYHAFSDQIDLDMTHQELRNITGLNN